jgi:penicillin-binding protein 2
VSRWLLLATLAAGLLFAACTGESDPTLTVPTRTLTPRPDPPFTRTASPVDTSTESPSETATETPTETATDEPAPTETVEDALPGEILEQFLTYWRDARYSDMYDLISTTAMERISRADFVKSYRDIAEVAGIQSVKGILSTADRAATLQSYNVTITTHLFGDIKEKNVANFIEEDRWRIDWTPALIFKDLSGSNLIHLFSLQPKRGAILDRNGEPLAITSTVVEVGVSKATIGDEATTVQFLADRLGMSVDEVYAKVRVDLPDYYFIPIKTLPYNADQGLVAELRANPNVILHDTDTRVYPHGSLAAHVVGYMGKISPEELEELKPEGYTDQDMVGKAGIEGIFEKELAGTRGARLAVISPEGATLTVIAERPSAEGKDITLSIDAHAQEVAEAALGERTGASVLLDPRDNSILAMASWPRFDPNKFIAGLSDAEFNDLFNNPLFPLFNRAAQGLYPPGSTFKVITAAAGLEEGGYNADSSFPCPPVWYGLGPENAKKNWNTADEGALTIAGGLMRSCNPVFFDIGLKLDGIDPNILPEFARAFGLGAPAVAQGLAEEAGIAPGPEWKEGELSEPWYTGDTVNMSIGQGYTLVTPLQMANVYSSIAMGSLREVTLVTKISAPGTSPQEFQAEEVAPLPVSAATLEVVRDGMRRVTSDPRGTAANVFSGSPLQFAGKSGTAEDVDLDNVWFAAYANLDDPQAVCVTVFEAGESGSQEVGPVVRQIVEGWLLGGE